MIVTATVEAVAAQTPSGEDRKQHHDSNCNPEQPPYLNLLKDGANSVTAAMAPPLFIVQKKLVAPGPGLEPVEVLEAVSPRWQTGLPQLIRAVPYSQRNNIGASTRAKEKPKLRPKPLTEATVASVPKQSGPDSMRQWLANMEVPANTEYAALAIAEAQCEALSSASGSRMSGCSTAGGYGGTFAKPFALGVLSRRLGRHIRRKPLQCVRFAWHHVLQAFHSTALDATEWPLSHILTDIEECEEC